VSQITESQQYIQPGREHDPLAGLLTDITMPSWLAIKHGLGPDGAMPPDVRERWDREQPF
jgi:hypothetical protein